MHRYPYYYSSTYAPYLYPHMYFRQPSAEEEMMHVLKTKHTKLYNQMEQAGMPRAFTDYVFMLVVTFVLYQAKKNQTAEQIYSQFLRQYPWTQALFRRFEVPQRVTDRVMVRVIQIVLNQLSGHRYY